MSIGQQLKAAREAKDLTTSQVALKTRIKVQHIENMERDDFSHIAAAAYARGFIKLYADFLGLDYRPLVDEYTENHAPAQNISLDADHPPHTPRPKKTREPRERKPIEWAWLNRLRQVRLSREQVARIGRGVIMIITIVALVSGFSYMFRSCARKRAEKRAERQQQAPVSLNVFPNEIIEEPPDPYIGAGARRQEPQ
ncbi:MAG: hypothetical protein EOM20_15335 [Spartobacteria bacterium]|nr:hypothetical protein [Spartobacteria bacterium]